MFMLARKSVTFEVDDLGQEYIDEIKRNHGDLWFNANHIEAVEEFGTPKGWRKVYHERKYLYKSPHAPTTGDIFGYPMRFERV
jgi:hypothetical protein